MCFLFFCIPWYSVVFQYLMETKLGLKVLWSETSKSPAMMFFLLPGKHLWGEGRVCITESNIGDVILIWFKISPGYQTWQTYTNIRKVQWKLPEKCLTSMKSGCILPSTFRWKETISLPGSCVVLAWFGSHTDTAAFRRHPGWLKVVKKCWEDESIGGFNMLGILASSWTEDFCVWLLTPHFSPFKVRSIPALFIRCKAIHQNLARYEHVSLVTVV